MSTAPAPDSPRRDWREAALIAVAVALMVVSISGQVQVLDPLMGTAFALLYAIANDFGAILALDALMTARTGSSVRKWAWVAILLAATPGAMLNAWHVMHRDSAAALPTAMGLIVGVEPILLLLVLSHLIGLAVAAGRERRQADSEVGTASTGSSPRPRAATASTPPVVASSTASLVATVGTPDRERAPARPRAVAAASGEVAPTVRQTVKPAPSPAGALPGPRPDWMSAALVASVVRSMRATGHPRPRYGETRLVRDHQLDDGSKIGSDRAKKVLAYINSHELWREPA